MSDDLIERLRNFTEEDAYAMPWTFGAVIREAADELARLRAEVERLRGQAEINNKMVKKTADDVVRYKARAERAEAALADERAHADDLADTLYSIDGLQKRDCEMRDYALRDHRARRSP